MHKIHRISEILSKLHYTFAPSHFFKNALENRKPRTQDIIKRTGLFCEKVIEGNVLPFCVRAGFSAQQLIRRIELTYTQKASNEVQDPA
jgi:hypothetical protein